MTEAPMDTIRYTALIRTRNSAPTLPKTLASLSAQTLPPCDHVIVDSGSTDDTLAHVPSGALVHRFVGATFNYSEALNQGLEYVKTEYVLIISSHTSLANPEALAYALALLAGDENIGAAYFCYENSEALEHTRIDASNFTGFNGLWNTCAVIKTALAKKRPFRPEVFCAEDQEWAKWLFHHEGKAVARISGAGLQNDNPRKLALGKLLDEYVAVALFTNRSLLEWPNLARVAGKVVRPTFPLAPRDRFVNLFLFFRLLACRRTRPVIASARH